MLRVAFVTSQLTYIPRNYEDLFLSFFKNCNNNIDAVGLILLKNLNIGLLKSIIGLRYLGANNIQKSLLANMLNLPFKRREKIFKNKGAEVLNFKSMNDLDAINWVRKNDIDILINVRTRCIYKEEILNSPRLGCLNIHHGILPHYRGTMCDLYALSENRPAGFSIHLMNKKVDDGQIFSVIEVSNGEHQDYLEYLNLGAVKEGKELAQLINKIIESGSFPDGKPNRSKKITYTKNPTRKMIQGLKKKGLII